MKGRFVFATLALLAAVGPAAGADRAWHFDGDRAGLSPNGFYVTAGQWKVKDDVTAPSRPNVLAQTARSSGGTFNLALIAGASYRNLDLSVRMRPIDGRIDQGGGLVWRAKDGRNYYVVRYSPLAHDIVLYKVHNFGRVELRRVRTEGFAGWHTLRVRMNEDHIECYLDGTRYLDVRDVTFREAGQIGLWTRADAVTWFDDLKVTGE